MTRSALVAMLTVASILDRRIERSIMAKMIETFIAGVIIGLLLIVILFALILAKFANDAHAEPQWCSDQTVLKTVKKSVMNNFTEVNAQIPAVMRDGFGLPAKFGDLVEAGRNGMFKQIARDYWKKSPRARAGRLSEKEIDDIVSVLDSPSAKHVLERFTLIYDTMVTLDESTAVATAFDPYVNRATCQVTMTVSYEAWLNDPTLSPKDRRLFEMAMETLRATQRDHPTATYAVQKNAHGDYVVTLIDDGFPQR